MSNVVIRQNDLFIAEEWDVVYEAYSNISFNTYSFDSIKISLVKYLRENYPEDFNDWTENSEFIMLIDLLAYLGESISYRVDLNTRDNFIDTAERKESVLRLAKMLSYNPSRNIAASGKVKIKTISTNQYIVDSNGKNIQNRPIIWNDPNNPDWFEHYTLVMNAAFNIGNRFGKPAKQVNSGGIVKQLYRMNNTLRASVTKSFNSVVTGENMSFEIYNPDMDIDGNISERHPNPDDSMNIIYQTDGAGNGSYNTGFFLYFKQGTLKFNSYNYADPIENRVEHINHANINNNDVWVSQIRTNGSIVDEWTKVGAVESNVYNNVDKRNRNIFSVQTLNDDKINVRYPDGNSGNAPKGLMRIWYRISNGLEYTINPQDMRGKTVNYSYHSNNGVDKDASYDLTISFDLEETISNSAQSEAIDSIRENAPRTYYTQGRMVNGEDYNSLPLGIGQNVKKIKAVNRIYSGQSPYFNNSDPTKRYSSTVEFGDDGILYKDVYMEKTNETFPTTLTPLEIAQYHIAPLIENINTSLFFTDVTGQFDITGYTWKKYSGQYNQSTGYFANPSDTPININESEPFPANVITEGAYLKFSDGKRAKVISISNDGLPADDGPVVLDEFIPNNVQLIGVMPYFRQTLSTADYESIAALITNNNTFGLAYDHEYDRWRIIDELNVSPSDVEYSEQYAGDGSNTNKDASWIIKVEYSTFGYGFYARQTRYVFESDKISRFYFHPEFAGSNFISGEAQFSNIELLKMNINNATGLPFEESSSIRFYDSVRYIDGYVDPRRIVVVPYDLDKDGSYDNPNLFAEMVNNGDPAKEMIFQKAYTQDGYKYWANTPKVLSSINQAGLLSYDWSENPANYEVGYSIEDKAFFVYQNSSLVVVEGYRGYVGRSGLMYKYEHFSPENNRIDPAITNVIDMYVLTKAYHDEVHKWKNGNRLTDIPEPAKSSSIQDSFGNMNDYKMISDQLIWNSAKYTPIFGTNAISENQAVIKVVKVPNSSITDNQLKQEIITAIDQFFDQDKWDFGETVYISELCSYIHQELAPELAFIAFIKKETTEDEDMYQIRQDFNSIFLNTATVDDIVIVPTASHQLIKN